jgi:hypothetical protein
MPPIATKPDCSTDSVLAATRFARSGTAVAAATASSISRREIFDICSSY